LKVRYYLGKNSKSLEGVENLKVDEGSKVPLRITHVNPKEYDISSLIYNLTVKPDHGWLVNSSLSQDQKNVSSFTLEDVLTQTIYYVHDDSETKMWGNFESRLS